MNAIGVAAAPARSLAPVAARGRREPGRGHAGARRRETRLLLRPLLPHDVLEVGEPGVGRSLELADLVVDGREDLEELRVLARAGEAAKLFQGLKRNFDNESL